MVIAVTGFLQCNVVIALLIAFSLMMGCAEPISTVVVREAAHGAALTTSETQGVESICREVAISHRLELKPITAWSSGIKEYAKRLPLSPGGFGGPSIVLSLVTPGDLAAITINGTGSPHPTMDRLQIAAELKEKLIRRYGNERVKAYEQNWMQF